MGLLEDMEMIVGDKAIRNDCKRIFFLERKGEASRLNRRGDLRTRRCMARAWWRG